MALAKKCDSSDPVKRASAQQDAGYIRDMWPPGISQPPPPPPAFHSWPARSLTAATSAADRRAAQRPPVTPVRPDDGIAWDAPDADLGGASAAGGGEAAMKERTEVAAWRRRSTSAYLTCKKGGRGRGTTRVVVLR
jgi:hypothetical protein